MPISKYHREVQVQSSDTKFKSHESFCRNQSIISVKELMQSCWLIFIVFDSKIMKVYMHEKTRVVKIWLQVIKSVQRWWLVKWVEVSWVRQVCVLRLNTCCAYVLCTNANDEVIAHLACSFGNHFGKQRHLCRQLVTFKQTVTSLLSEQLFGCESLKWCQRCCWFRL